MKDRVKRKITWENQGVSEIIGTILMLTITVVLFSTIITWVGQLPPPRESFHVDLEATLDPVNTFNWSEGVWLNIRHQGGQDMDGLLVSLFITVDAVTFEKALDEGGLDVADDEWSFGEVWSIFISKGGANAVPSLEGPLPASVFKILIINNEKNAIIWTHTLGEADNHYAPIVLDAWIDSDLGTVVDDPGPISYTEPFKFYARIVDPEGYDPVYGLDPTTEGAIWVDLSSIGLSDHVDLTDIVNETAYPEYSGRDALHDNVYVAICDAPAITVNVGYYYFWVHAVDLAGEGVERAVRFPVGMIVGDNPQIYVNNIDFSDEEPVNGDTIMIYADIRNQGGAGSRVDVCFYDVTNNNTLINLNNESILISVAAMGQSEARVSWKASPGGVHVINVTAYVHVNETKADPFLDDNYLEKPISVMPKILLVDDDNAVNDQSSTDTVSFMRASLESADFAYDFYLVGAGDGPGYDYGDNHLEEYDVVIWMTGYEESNTITPTDCEELEKYLQPSTTDNGGSLWLISQGYFWEGGADLLTFAQDYLHVQSPQPDPGLPGQLYGNNSHPDVSYPTGYLRHNPLETINRIGSPDQKYTRSYFWPEGARHPDNVALNESWSTDAYALTYNSTAKDTDPIVDSRLFIQPWEFSRIKDTSAQSQYTYKVILWLGNITQKLTKDVAISEQTIEPKVVFYKQKVTISFVIRNNGFSDYNATNTSSPDLEFLLRITDVYGQTDLVEPYYDQVRYLGTGINNTITIVYNWTPEEVGYHRLIIKVDPYDRIEESNELNNEISDFLSSGELNVQFRILVVDDDGSVNNNGPYVNETLEVTTALDMLNATGQYTYETYLVNHTEPGPDFDGEDISLDKYNAVLWVIGEDVVEPLSSDDQDNITDYLKIGGCLWLIGDGLWIWGDTITNPSFEHDMLRIDSVIGDADTPTMLNGLRDDEVSHGMQFSGSGGGNGDALVPTAEGVSFFYQNITLGTNNSVRYEGPPVLDSNATCKVATTAWLLSSLDSNESKAELVFMMLRWFDKPEDRIEARITDYDIWLSDTHPQFGSGYVLQATVHNTGGATANVLVRFMDGDTQIGSDSISVSPGEVTTAEIVWIPLFAGQRILQILVDPILEVDEIFEWSNNNATLSTYVYFFWDDMESGAGKWAHSSTILLINGEEPLEYLTGTTLDTNIATEWDDALSDNFTYNYDPGFYHTWDTSTWLQEPTGGEAIRGIGEYIYEFYLQTDGSQGVSNAGNQGIFISGIMEDSVYTLHQLDNNGDWQPIRSDVAIKQGKFKSYVHEAGGPNDDIDSGRLYRVNSTGPLNFVIGSDEGGNINVPNYDDGLLTGKNFISMANVPTAGTIPNLLVVALEPGSTQVTTQFYQEIDYNQEPPVGAMAPTNGLATRTIAQGSFEFFEHSTVLATVSVGHVQADKNVLVYRLIDKSDDFDTAISTSGYSNGTDFYFPISTDAQPRLIVYNQDNAPVTIEIDELTSGTIPHRTINLGPLESMTDAFIHPGVDPIQVYRARVTSGGEVKIIYGQQLTISSSFEFMGIETDVDEYTFGAPYLYGGISGDSIADGNHPAPPPAGNGLYKGVQHFNTYGKTNITLGTNPVPITDSGGGQNWFSYFSSTGCTLRFRSRNGAMLGSASDMETGVSYWVDGLTAYFPKGIHDVEITQSGAGELAIDKFELEATADVGSFAWAVEKTSVIWNTTNPQTKMFTDPDQPYWKYISDEPMLYLMWASGNRFEHTILPFEGSISFIGGGTVTGENVTRSGGSQPGLNDISKYDYTGITTGSGPHYAYFQDVDDPSDFDTPNPQSEEFSDYSKVVTSDDDRLDSLSAGNGDRIFVESRFQIAEAPASIISISLTIEIQAVDFDTFFRIYAYNQITTQWDPMGADSPWMVKQQDITLTRWIDTNCDRYIDGTGVLKWGCYETVDDNKVSVDYIEVVVTYGGGGLGSPEIVYTDPEDGEMNVNIGRDISVVFSESMNTGTVTYNITPDPGGLNVIWNSAHTLMTIEHETFDFVTQYFVEITGGEDMDAMPLVPGSVPNPWTFTTQAMGSSGGGWGASTPGLSPDGPNCNKSAVTDSFDLRNVESSTLSFWHKYNMVSGVNGGVLMVGWKESSGGPFKFRYVVPSSSYTGNLRLTDTARVDDMGVPIIWCWNGVSGTGTFAWEKVSLDILSYINKTGQGGYDPLSAVKVKFAYYQYGGGTGYGWYIDDVRVVVSRSDTMAPTPATQDIWDLINMTSAGIGGGAHSGDHAWSNFDPSNPNMMKPGIDNYLMTAPIDLTNARSAYMSAYMKFNINEDDGAPPDGFRVEVSTNNGVSWSPINLGVRSSEGISGTGADADDGKDDGKAYTGLTDSYDPGNPGAYDPSVDDYWVNMDTLTRVNIDLSSFSGNAIHIRFRMVTNNHYLYEHNNNHNQGLSDFGGFYVDDVIVFGETILT